MTRALSVPDQPTSRGEPINELVPSICQVVAPTPRSLNDRFQFLSTAFRAPVAHLESGAGLNSNSDILSPKGEKGRKRGWPRKFIDSRCMRFSLISAGLHKLPRVPKFGRGRTGGSRMCAIYNWLRADR